MCPACIATTAWLVAGSASAGGVTAFIATKLLRREPDAPPRDADETQPAERRQ